MSYQILNPRVAFDGTFRESLGKLTFRDALLSMETRGRGGLRKFLPLPGLCRLSAAREIVRIFGANRLHCEQAEEMLIYNTRADDAAKSTEIPKRDELVLAAPVHSVFSRPQVPVSLMLDIDMKSNHQFTFPEGSNDSFLPSSSNSSASSSSPTSTSSSNSTSASKQLEDRVVGLTLSACRGVFLKNGLAADKVCVLTASDFSVKKYASLHVHIDLVGACFADGASLGNFVKNDLLDEMKKIGSKSSASQELCQQVISAVDVTQCGLTPGSLRIYGSPKLDGSRPLRLFQPLQGGAAFTALHLLNPKRGGPSMSLLRNKNVLNFDLENYPGRDKRSRRPVLDLELEALAMSLGTPDWMAPAVPFKLLKFSAPSHSSRSSSSCSSSSPLGQSASHNTSSSSSSSQINTSSSSSSSNVKILISSLPSDVQSLIRDPDERIPNITRANASPRAYALLASVVVPQIPVEFAQPYNTWIKVCMGMTFLAQHCSQEAPELENVLRDSFLRFSDRAPNYSQQACLSLWNRMRYKRKKDARTLSRSELHITNRTSNASAVYSTLIRYFNKK